MNAAPAQTVTGQYAEAQLFGGRLDGSTVPVEIHNGSLPDKIETAFGEYHADGTTRDGMPRYSLPQYAGQLTRGKTG